MFREKMTTPAIPERVYALCKIVEKGPISSRDLKERMEPSYLNQSSSYFGDYRAAAEELKLIVISDNVVSLAVASSTIHSIFDMRSHVNSMLASEAGVSGPRFWASVICRICFLSPMPMFSCAI